MKVDLPSDTLEINRLMLVCGVPRQVTTIPSYELSDSLALIESSDNGNKPHTIKAHEQMEGLAKVMDSPLVSPYTMCISSEPNDNRAKLLAARILYTALSIPQSSQTIEPPIYRSITSVSREPLLEKNLRYTLLVLANITGDSSLFRLERLRDILEVHSDRPRIVVTSGIDPVSLFRNRLHYPLNFAVYMKTRAKQEEI